MRGSHTKAEAKCLWPINQGNCIGYIKSGRWAIAEDREPDAGCGTQKSGAGPGPGVGAGAAIRRQRCLRFGFCVASHCLPVADLNVFSLAFGYVFSSSSSSKLPLSLALAGSTAQTMTTAKIIKE